LGFESLPRSLTVRVKVLSLLVVLLLAAAVAACGDDDTSGSEAAATPEPTTAPPNVDEIAAGIGPNETLIFAVDLQKLN
jgi:hypothetical protein